MDSTAKFKKMLDNYEDEVEDMYHKAWMLSRKENYTAIDIDIKSFFQKNCPKYEKHAFYGSRIAGLGNDSSDLDVEIKTKGNFNDDDFMNIWSRLENNPKFVQKKYVKAIPLATVLHKSTGITLDLVFKSAFGEEKTRALHQWLGMQYEEGFRFVLFIRKWFDSSSSFDSKYHKMLDMLSVFWLVKEEVLPSFKEIQEFYKSDPRSVMDFATPDYQDYNKLMIASFTEHVAGFFKYFAEFDWENLIVSPYTGTAIKKTDFFWVEDFQTESNPIAIALTKQKLKSCNPNDCTEHMLAKSNFFCHLTLKPNTDSVYLDIAKPMIVLSFVDANKNYAIHVAKNMVPVFVQFCRKSHELIAAHSSFQ